MKNDKGERRLIIAVALAAVLALFGSFYIYSGFRESANEMSMEYSQHLMDTAWSVDSSVDSILRSSREQLEQMVTLCRDDEEEYLRSGDGTALRNTMSARLRSRSAYSVTALFIHEEQVLITVGEGEGHSFSFPEGISIKRPFICTDSHGNSYMAIARRAEDPLCRYALILDTDSFYRKSVGNNLTKSYRLTLYNTESGLILFSDGLQPEIEHISRDEALSRPDGTSVLASAEDEGRMAMERYKSGTADETLMVVLPTGINTNGFFAVGLALPTLGFMKILRHIFLCMLMGGVLVLMSVGSLILLFYDNRRSNAAMKEKVELLERENNTVQELAHHQRLEMIGTMTGSLAHEFNNMLTPIMGYSLMTMEQLPEGCDDLVDNLSEILEAAEKAKGLIVRMSSLTRKNTDASNKLLSPDAVAEKVCRITAPSVPGRVEVVKQLHCPEELLFANETQICQLLMNLVNNAFQAMEEDGGVLTVSTALEGGNVVFRLRDTGPGIPENELKRIFEPFFTTKEIGRGTGLGLAIATQIAANHNGSIAAESEVGVGTVFTVTLPARITQ